MELRRLRYFVTVAEELHFGRAAERLHMAQSPLSRQIQHLERELRTPLFRRTTRSVHLTPAGVELLDRARRLLAEAEDTVRAVRDADRDAAPVRLGFTPSAANAVLHTVLRSVRRETGRLPVDVRSDQLTPAQLGAITGGLIDVAFVVRPRAPFPDGLEVRVVRTEPLAVVLPDGHRLADAESVRLADLADEDVVAFSAAAGSALRALLDASCLARGFRPRVVHEARSTATLLGLVAAGVGCTVLPLAAREGAAAGVTVRPFADGIDVEIAMVWRRGEPRRNVLTVVEAVLRGIATDGAADTVTDTDDPLSPRERPWPGPIRMAAVPGRTRAGLAPASAHPMPRT
ncbi:LysR substrate-binding domain-containing protein [Pseudonocardia sp.]|uniref:LysR substrate-binding domain-containing protein n=1 Tax=Pseudonocardia sp. TaxID=60912 RepID=UPI003D0BDC00